MRDESGMHKVPKDTLDQVVTVLVAEQLADATTDGNLRPFTVRDRERLKAILDSIEPQNDIRAAAEKHFYAVRDYLRTLPAKTRDAVDPEVESYRKMLVEMPSTRH